MATESTVQDGLGNYRTPARVTRLMCIPQSSIVVLPTLPTDVAKWKVRVNLVDFCKAYPESSDQRQRSCKSLIHLLYGSQTTSAVIQVVALEQEVFNACADLAIGPQRPRCTWTTYQHMILCITRQDSILIVLLNYSALASRITLCLVVLVYSPFHAPPSRVVLPCGIRHKIFSIRNTTTSIPVLYGFQVAHGPGFLPQDWYKRD
ncbi:LOW QUALITY PROTEIN: hypothetical protein CVT26_004655 [Gymnopilus dilepis]|uniref:Uncharacterized protein n=1 Tax=Gymnopilus dilepis TaxID=231916 RepID=A0A409YTQ8_9AGAR|nr:LOW QUALITY PROTEIN: hypothetical protein CVT26_004655 [Gymnopilus dilepis]